MCLQKAPFHVIVANSHAKMWELKVVIIYRCSVETVSFSWFVTVHLENGKTEHSLCSCAKLKGGIMQLYSFWSVWKDFFIQIYKMGSFSTVTIMLVVTLYTRMAGFKVQIHTYFIYMCVCTYRKRYRFFILFFALG